MFWPKHGAEVLMIENSSTNVTPDTHMPASRKFVVKDRDASKVSARPGKSTEFSLASLTSLSIFVVVFLMLTSCASVTEEEKYERQDRLMVAIENYEKKAAACSAMGATMMITARATRIKAYKYTRSDYEFAKCVKL